MIAGFCLAQESGYEFESSVRQGYVLDLATNAEAVTDARFLGKKIPLYPQGSRKEGLMPVPVTQKIGRFPLEFLDEKDTVVHRALVRVVDGKYLQQNIRTTKRMRSTTTSTDERKKMADFRAYLSPVRLWARPIRNPVPECTTSPFGVKRLHDGKFTGNFHGGLDFNSPTGRIVRAVADGEVKVAAMFTRQGGTVGLDHGQGLQTTYIHLSKVIATEGSTVKKGDVIGHVGSTGFSTGPHLHFSVNVHGVPVHPLQWLAPVKACR